MFLPLSRAEKQLSDPTQRIHKVLETARILYGLIHARYVLTAQGLTDMVRRLAWCWLRTCVHARVFFRSRSRTLSLSPRSLLLALSLSLSCRLARSLHLSLRALSNTTALPLNSPSRTASFAPPSLYSSSSVTTSHRAATKVRPVRSFNLPIAHSRPRTDTRRKPNTRLTSSARARARSARSRQYFRRGCLTRHR